MEVIELYGFLLKDNYILNQMKKGQPEKMFY